MGKNSIHDTICGLFAKCKEKKANMVGFCNRAGSTYIMYMSNDAASAETLPGYMWNPIKLKLLEMLKDAPPLSEEYAADYKTFMLPVDEVTLQFTGRYDKDNNRFEFEVEELTDDEFEEVK